MLLLTAALGVAIAWLIVRDSDRNYAIQRRLLEYNRVQTDILRHIEAELRSSLANVPADLVDRNLKAQPWAPYVAPKEEELLPQ